MSAMEEAIGEFTSECEEMLERISLSLSSLEKGEIDNETISSIYRDMHTIKGSSQLFGFHQIGSIAHAMESSLDPIRQGLIKPNSNLIDVIYKGCDIVSHLVKSIKENKVEHDAEAEMLDCIPKLIDMTIRSIGGSTRFLRDDFIGFDVVSNADTPKFDAQAHKHAATATTSSETKVEASPASVEAAPKKVEPKPVAAKPSTPTEEKTAGPEASAVKKSEPVAAKAAPEKVVSTPVAQVEKKEVPAPKASPTTPKAASPAPAPSTPKPKSTKPEKKANTMTEKKADSQETIRVHVTLLDKLMNLAGELVLVRNQVLRFAADDKNPEFAKLAQKVNLVTTEIQAEVMKTRMQPVGSILSKFHRVVRDLAKELNKRIELKLEGTETELDKTLIEAVKDPLTHIVRNSADHGLETPEERLASGKGEVGQIMINSYHEGGQVVIEIADNGRGLDRDKIGQKALEKGIVNNDQLANMSDREVHQLIFAPGFSTAASISNISGRGVGMDVVKTNIERIGGVIDLNSTLGKGTTLLLKIPLTLAIVPALLIRSGDQRFAIPQVKLLELLRIDLSEDSENKIETLQGKPVYRLRGQLLPLVCLDQLLDPSLERSSFLDDPTCNIVVLKAGTTAFGLIVEDIEDSADIVVKPLTQFLKSLGLYAGATLLGDGTVALTLDVMGIAEKALIGHNDEDSDFLAGARDKNRKLEEITDYLIVDVHDQSKYAFPLSLVNRLEEFKDSEYDYSGGQRVVRYRGKLLPIISVLDYYGFPKKEKADPSEPNPIVVVMYQERLFGLEVGEILDVIGSTAAIDDQIKSHQGILGSFIDRDQVFVVIDAFKIIQDYADSHGIKLEPPKKAANSEHILVVEDSKFFRNHIRNCLESNGYKVTTADDGVQGLEMVEANKDELTMILSDIEMPRMDGYTFAEKVNSDTSTKHIPMVAVTTRFRESDIKRGKDVGFIDYLEKLNEEILLKTINEIINGG